MISKKKELIQVVKRSNYDRKDDVGRHQRHVGVKQEGTDACVSDQAVQEQVDSAVEARDDKNRSLEWKLPPENELFNETCPGASSQVIQQHLLSQHFDHFAVGLFPAVHFDDFDSIEQLLQQIDPSVAFLGR